MKNKKNSMIIIAMLIAVVCLGIGYALSTTSLTINGTATAKENTDFDVYFTKAEADSTQVTTGDDEKTSTAALVSADSNNHSKVAEMKVVLKKVGSSQTATFTVENGSAEGLAAKIKGSNVLICKTADCTSSDFSSDYFNVTTSLTDTTIASKKAAESSFHTTDFTVTVTLKKSAVTEQEENFFVVLKDIEAVQD